MLMLKPHSTSNASGPDLSIILVPLYFLYLTRVPFCRPQLPPGHSRTNTQTPPLSQIHNYTAVCDIQRATRADAARLFSMICM